MGGIITFLMPAPPVSPFRLFCRSDVTKKSYKEKSFKEFFCFNQLTNDFSRGIPAARDCHVIKLKVSCGKSSLCATNPSSASPVTTWRSEIISSEFSWNILAGLLWMWWNLQGSFEENPVLGRWQTLFRVELWCPAGRVPRVCWQWGFSEQAAGSCLLPALQKCPMLQHVERLDHISQNRWLQLFQTFPGEDEVLQAEQRGELCDHWGKLQKIWQENVGNHGWICMRKRIVTYVWKLFMLIVVFKNIFHVYFHTISTLSKGLMTA